MIYVILTLSLVANGLLVWYVRKLLSKYWADVEVREKFTDLLDQYAESLQSIYKMEEFYGEEILKKAIQETRFVEEACKEYKKILETEINEKDYFEEEGSGQEDTQNKKENNTIRLKEGESVSQNAAEYKRVVSDPF